jgi:hypothetical protein
LGAAHALSTIANMAASLKSELAYHQTCLHAALKHSGLNFGRLPMALRTALSMVGEWRPVKRSTPRAFMAALDKAMHSDLFAGDAIPVQVRRIRGHLVDIARTAVELARLFWPAAVAELAQLYVVRPSILPFPLPPTAYKRAAVFPTPPPTPPRHEDKRLVCAALCRPDSPVSPGPFVDSNASVVGNVTTDTERMPDPINAPFPVDLAEVLGWPPDGDDDDNKSAEQGCLVADELIDLGPLPLAVTDPTTNMSAYMLDSILASPPVPNKPSNPRSTVVPCDVRETMITPTFRLRVCDTNRAAPAARPPALTYQFGGSLGPRPRLSFRFATK